MKRDIYATFSLAFSVVRDNAPTTSVTRALQKKENFIQEKQQNLFGCLIRFNAQTNDNYRFVSVVLAA